MVSSLATLTLALALGSAGGIHPTHDGSPVMPPGPGNGWGFPNGNPDGVGWWDNGPLLPLGADRTPDYFFPRYLALPPEQVFLPTYYNSYVTRGQRYIPYAGCGGWHPMGGPPPAQADLPLHPGIEAARRPPVVPVPAYRGRVEAAPVNPGGTGLTP